MTDETQSGPPEFAAVLKAARELSKAVQTAIDVGLDIDIVLEEFRVRDKVHKQVMVYLLSLPGDKG